MLAFVAVSVAVPAESSAKNWTNGNLVRRGLTTLYGYSLLLNLNMARMTQASQRRATPFPGVSPIALFLPVCILSPG
ncbi:hypothetical protein E2C01_079668 [Portunus trituberculatus]|uniref:Uncharacterized protein n=1 Tax=Portunus trituberculatus TaxID=210409 RepID=A0A5B7IQX3_PORTR|nr:hypothetical protein [Portunus trituberculatus]